MSNNLITLKFITYNELEKILVCDDNKKLIDDYKEISSIIEPLSDRPPVPISSIKSKKRKT